ncbi:MAG: outer membrane beta-barrel protein [Bacteroidia bacterium]
MAKRFPGLKLLFLVMMLLFCFTKSAAQQADSIRKKNEDAQNIIFSGTRMAPKEEEFDTTGRLDISGYVSVYYAHYTDSAGNDQYQKFPTLCPVGDAVGLNLIQVSARYTAKTIRGIVTLHWGDMPTSAWSPKYTVIQQANMGIRIIPKLWFDIGYFRTHIGLESVQPRENINSTMAVTTFFEPYYLAGAKLTWQASSKFALQVNSFNQFNGYNENNKKKAFGLSATWDIRSNLSLVFNTITTDDAPDDAPRRQQRIYTDFYLVYKSKKIVLGYELNFGAQQNSGLKDSSETATMISSLLAIKYKINKRLGVYTRLEYFNDKNGLMGDIYKNAIGSQLGLNMSGIDGGIEIKPVPNSYVRFEYRYLHENVPEGNIFYYHGSFRPYRNEFVFSTGLWF